MQMLSTRRRGFSIFEHSSFVLRKVSTCFSKISFGFGSDTLANSTFHTAYLIFRSREIKVRRHGAFDVKDSEILVSSTPILF